MRIKVQPSIKSTKSLAARLDRWNIRYIVRFELKINKTMLIPKSKDNLEYGVLS